MPVFLSRSLLALILLALSALAFPTGSQSLAQNGSAIVTKQRAVMDSLRQRTDLLEKQIAANSEDDARLVDTRLQLEEAEHQLLQSSVAFRPRLAEINARLDQLGPAPAEGQPPEPDLVARERQALMAEKAEINAALGVAEDQSIRINALITRITEMRRELFSRLLTRRYDIGTALAGEVAEAARGEITELYRTVSSWLRFVVQFKLRSVLFATFFALLAAAILLIGGRRLFGRLFVADGDIETPSYLSRLSVAFWSTLVPTAALAVFLAATYLLYDYFGVLWGDIGTMMTSLFIVIGLVFFVYRLGSSVLSPRLPNWRLIAVDTHAARLLLWLVSATAIFTGIDVFLSTVYSVLDSPLSLTVGESLIATVLTGILVVLIGLVRPFTGEDGRPRRWHPLLSAVLFLLGGVTIVAALLGYIGFARFLSAQIVVTGAVLATMYIGFLSAGAVAEEGAFASTTLGRRFESRFSLDPATLDQLALVVSIAINILILVVGVPLILFLWGFQPGDIQAWVYKAVTGIRIGSFTLSFTGIFWGILVFILGYFLTRWFQGWLDGSVMARGKVDAGVRNSIRTVVGYAGLAIAALMGVSAAGIDLSNFALIAGGLSLGIGFGLQNVVSNFVSGLILLAERPFKAGDWIVAGPVSGTVKKISVRATEIETFQRQTVILPNSELINSAVGNWTHRNKLGRIEIPVGVGYGSDAKRVHEILLDIASNHPLVLKNPEPFVLFSAFGDSSLDFEIRVFLADVSNGIIVQNDVRFAILEAFARENIEIPFPQRDVHLKREPPAEKWPIDDDKLEAEHFELAKALEEKAMPPPASRRKRRKPDPN
ncbi:mechanosensitive ion channel family protein [Mesorhizobium sp. WSM2239]|uniref:Mechanosensitive ion channel family protein n=2 Tax=unclassified Mesorhizobium TaxID=325217 RepID=A0AAU8DFK2_9HYPH